MYIKESRDCIKKSLVDLFAYAFIDILFLDSHSPYFLKKNGLKLLKEKALETLPKYLRTGANKLALGKPKKKLYLKLHHICLIFKNVDSFIMISFNL